MKLYYGGDKKQMAIVKQDDMNQSIHMLDIVPLWVLEVRKCFISSNLGELTLLSRNSALIN